MNNYYLPLALCILLVSILIYTIRLSGRINRLERYLKEYTDTESDSSKAQIEGLTSSGDIVSSLAIMMYSIILKKESLKRDSDRTAKELTDSRKKVQEMSEVAIMDELTGIRNKAAYEKEVKKLEWDMGYDHSDFAIVLVDLNDLKGINERNGHEKGDEAIRKLCRMVCKKFAHSAVFRLGTDEFIAILRKEDFENRDLLLKEFEMDMENMASDAGLEEWEKISAAIGMAEYIPEVDPGTDTVYQRARNAMEERKQEMKEYME